MFPFCVGNKFYEMTSWLFWFPWIYRQVPFLRNYRIDFLGSLFISLYILTTSCVEHMGEIDKKKPRVHCI